MTNVPLPHLAAILMLALVSACGAGQSPSSTGETNGAAAEADPDPNRDVSTPGGYATFGFRATPRGDEERVQIVGVLVDLDGEETVTDLGDWEGELTAVQTEEGELVRLHLEGAEHHEFVAVPTGDGELVLMIDGRRAHRLHFEAAARIEADEPLRLNPPRLVE